MKSNVPVLIAGKELLNDLMAQLGSPFRERSNEREDPKKIIALSEIHYFKVDHNNSLVDTVTLQFPASHGRPSQCDKWK